MIFVKIDSQNRFKFKNCHSNFVSIVNCLHKVEEVEIVDEAAVPEEVHSSSFLQDVTFARTRMSISLRFCAFEQNLIENRQKGCPC